MKNRFSKAARGKTWLLILLSVSGVVSSCKDEYLLDDEKPTWLDVSIYENLQRRGSYSNYLKLLADPAVNNAEDADNNRGLVDVLSKTGSKTVFVANDDAWKEFFQQNALLPKSNPWHYATSYDKLSEAQKKLLIHTSMLNNAIVMENLANSEGADGTRGEYVRRQTDVELTDTITFVSGDDIPVNYNVGNGEADYWYRFRTENGGNGIYLVSDGTPSMMLHFTNEYLAKKGITDEDFEKFTGQPRITTDVHIYNHKITTKDAVCENGYVNTTDGVLLPLPNMAEVLRTNGQTNIFSHMLDRWSAPFYNAEVTQAYKNVMAAQGKEWTDSIFTKRYFSDRSAGATALGTGPMGETFRDSASTSVTLKFDPGWNGYYANQTEPQQDMAAMFVPTDDALWDYFKQGNGGWQLIETYCASPLPVSDARTEQDYENLYRNIDQIPISTLKDLINVIMFPRFTSSVPSKMLSLRDDAQEQIFYEEDRKEHMVGSMLANNGVIYLTDKVFGPSNYTSVAGPAFISKDNLVIRSAIYSGSTKAESNGGFMGPFNYYAYLKAMQSRFVFLLPSDEAMKYVYDPVSFRSRHPRVVELKMKAKTTGANANPIEANLYDYKQETGEIGKLFKTESMSNSDIVNRLKDVLESHTIVLDGRDEIETDVDEYYVAKNGAPIRVIRENGKVVRVQGAFQIDNEANGISNSSPGVVVSNITETNKMTNGTTYGLDAPIVNAARSVYTLFTNNEKYDSEEYQAFYELCDAVNDSVLLNTGLVNSKLTGDARIRELTKYAVFYNEKGTAPDQNVQFFNNYRYTIFVPTREALEEAIANGLPTPASIEDDYRSCCNEDGELTTLEDSLRIQAKVTCLQNFVRNHFVDNSVFVDQSRIPTPKDEVDEYGGKPFVTASFDNDRGIFNKISVKREAGVLQVKDANNGEWMTVEGKVNAMTRDISTNKTPNEAINMTGISIEASSFAVVHQIPGVLNHTELQGGRYDSAWAGGDIASCRAYIKRYAIK